MPPRMRTRPKVLLLTSLLLLGTSASFAARVDVGVDTILLPMEYNLPPYMWFTPKAVWHNLGDTVASFTAWLALTDPSGNRTYCESMPVANLAPDSMDTLAFPEYMFLRTGYWALRCSTLAVGDADPTNDTLGCSLPVYYT